MGRIRQLAESPRRMTGRTLRFDRDAEIQRAAALLLASQPETAGCSLVVGMGLLADGSRERPARLCCRECQRSCCNFSFSRHHSRSKFGLGFEGL